MEQVLSVLFTTTTSDFLAFISLLQWIITFHKIFTFLFLTTPSGACSYYFSHFFRLYFPHNSNELFLQHCRAFSCTLSVPIFHIAHNMRYCFTLLVIYSTKWWLGCFIYHVFHIVCSNCLLLRVMQHGFRFNFQVSFSHPVPCSFFIHCFWHFSYKLPIHSFVFP